MVSCLDVRGHLHGKRESKKFRHRRTDIAAVRGVYWQLKHSSFKLQQGVIHIDH
jgi:hypothetical protein